MNTVIDAHQHVWDLARSRYDWLDSDLAPIDRTIEIDELMPSLRRAGVDGTVLVQSADTYEDTDLMLDVAAANPVVVAVVAYVPLDRPAEVAERVGALRSNDLIVGVRNLIHTMPDPQWLLRPDVDESLGLLEKAGLTFDLVSVLPEHLALVPRLVERHPNLKIVIDHLSKPPIGLDNREPWWSLIQDAASSPTVCAKVSGLYSATGDSGSWTPQSVRPFLDRAMETFGASRLMYGGDWPISILSGGYDRVWDGLQQLVSELPAAAQRQMWAESAIEFYGIAPARIALAIAAAGK
ncbi:MAG: amidohydrolase family protein [Lacisediminihabitans sp.]